MPLQKTADGIGLPEYEGAQPPENLAAFLLVVRSMASFYGRAVQGQLRLRRFLRSGRPTLYVLAHPDWSRGGGLLNRNEGVIIMAGTTQSLVFQNTKFDIADRNGQPWLRGTQIADALGYASSRQRISDIYTRHADEFTDSMTAVVKLPTAGGEQETRIFSLRGAHLLAMFSRTAVAKEFRRWVLDILDRETAVSLSPTSRAVEDSYALAAALLPEIAKAIQAGLTGKTYRWFLSFDYLRKPSITSIPDDAYMLSYSDMLKTMMSADGAPLKTEELEVFINAATRRLASRAVFHQQRALAQGH